MRYVFLLKISGFLLVFPQIQHAFAVILFNTGFWLQLNMLTKAGDLLPILVTRDEQQFGFKLLFAKIFKK